MRRPRLSVVLGGAALGAGLLAGGLGLAYQSDAFKRLLVSPTFDGADADRKQLPVKLVPRITGVPQPTDVAFVPGHPERVVVLSKSGKATLVDLKTGERAEWLEVDVATTSELGLLGVAFHPAFPADPRLWLNHTPSRGGRKAATVISEWKVDPATLAPTRVRDVLEVEQPYQNHDAGQLRFGPDGMLYVGFGDGGFRADPLNAGQDRATLLGAMLRLDVSGPEPYRVPADNPFVGVEGVRPEIWAYGLRNPWRYAFDPRGRLIVADVGQDAWEEISIVGAGDNLGWRVREGRHCFDPPEGCATEGLVDPIYEYGHDEGISITGGVVWTAPGPLQGRFLFGDFGTGRLWELALPETVRPTDDVLALGRFSANPSAFAAAPDGTVWVTDFSSGAVFELVAR